jgi:hypothetical protein
MVHFMRAQKALASSLARLFRTVYVARERQARAVARLAKRLGIATDQELRELEAQADLLLGRARRLARDEARP